MDTNIDLSNSSILIVDDNPSNLALLFNFLSRKGYNVLVADGGNNALKMAREAEPDLILLDIIMPEIDGYMVCTEIKKEQRFADTPVIFLSAVNSADDKLRAFQSGGVDYITKPFNYEELAARVSAQLTIKHQKHKLRQLYNDLEETNSRKDKLFSIISHDIRSPLSTIMGYSEIILEDFSELSNVEVKQYTRNIHNVSKEINGLVENLLDWSRLQMDKINYMPENIDLKTELERVICSYREAAALKKITLVHNVNTSEFITADYNMFYTIMRNLISNAIKFTGDGGNIFIVAENFLNRVKISVCDTGIGIEKKSIKNLFDFGSSSLKMGTNNEKGTGLGLMLCKEFVERHGGKLIVESEYGRGARFTFDLARKID